MKISTQIRSKNFNSRPNPRDIRYIILHYTERDFEESINLLTSNITEVSAHYLIDLNGDIYNLVDDKERAWHAGESYWQGNENLNNNSIGIEIVNSGLEKFTDEQYKNLIELCHYLMKNYEIHRNNVLAHSDIAPSRKIDPGPYFNWKLLSENGIGIKFEEIESLTHKIIDDTEIIIDIKTALKILGYKVNINNKIDDETSDLFRAFLLHFNQKTLLEKHRAEDIFNLSRKYYFDENSFKILNKIINEF